MIKKQSALVLASASKYRKQLLQQLNLDFLTAAADVDESVINGETPEQTVVRLADSKGLEIKKQHPTSIIISSDQLCTCESEIFGKAGNKKQAIIQLSLFSGKKVRFYTALNVFNPNKQINHRYTDVTTVKFRKLSVNAIDRYLDFEQPYDCAGSFKVESLGLTLFDYVESKDPSALIGLPLIKLSAFLRQCGIELP